MAKTDDIVAQLKAIHLAAGIERLRTTLTERDAQIERLTRERDEARAEVERKDAALLRIAERCRRPDLVARAALTKGGENGDA